MNKATLRLSPGDVVRIRTERWRVTAHLPFDTCAFVDVAGAEASNTGRRARFVAPFERIERLVGDTRPLVVRPARWRRIACARLAGLAPSPACLRTAASADIALMPFQLEPALAVTHGLASRLLIADAVGLGKTIQAGLIVAEVLVRAIDGHALIVTPAALREQWLGELRSRFSLDVGIVDATTTADTDRHASPWAMHGCTIASIDYIKRPEVLRGLEDMVWDVVVFDEAHRLTGHSDRARTAFEVAARGRVVVALTATPHGGDEAAFTRLCDLGRLAGDGPIAFFRRTRRDAGFVDGRRMRWLHVSPSTPERRMHDALDSYIRAVWRANLSHGARLAMIVLARRACSSPHALARSLERRLQLLGEDADASFQLRLPLESVDSDDEPAGELAAKGLDDASHERQQLEEVLRRARLALPDESKRHRLERLLQRTDEPVVAFTEYRDTLEHLAAALEKYEPARLHGGMTPGDRQECIRRFNSGSTRVLLATDAGSEGLNLHYQCRLVVNLEVPWTPLRLEQRIGRVDRIGQPRRVHAVQMIARGTPEEGVLHQLIDREWRARSSLDGVAHLDATAIATAAFGGGATGDATLAPAQNIGVSHTTRIAVLDLRGSAIEESRRVEVARRLLRGADADRVHRPAIAAISRRHADTRAYWAYVLTILGSDGEWLWHALVALTYRTPVQTFSTATQVRDVVDVAAHPLRKTAHGASARATSAFLAAMQLPIAAADARERAIQARIVARRSTMAAALVQQSLFDAREERRAAAESARLNAALDRCAARLNTLPRIDAVHASEPQLAFAVLIC